MLRTNLQLFGGRGSSSSLPMNNNPGGGGGPSGANMDAQPGVMSTAEEALGEKGRPMSIYNAVNGANPLHNLGPEYQENCQRCVIATEARLRGYDVQALPTYNNDTMPMGDSYLSNFVGAKSTFINKTTPRANKNAVENEMAGMGSNARATMSFNWSGCESGHVLNVVRKNGRTRYYDGQTGSEVNGTALFNAMSKTRPAITLTRVDNLAFSSTVNQAVTPSK